MLINQELHLEIPHMATIEMLKKHLNVFPPMGVVNDNSFYLYKSLCSGYRKGCVRFVFAGKIEATNFGTYVQYRVRPSWFTLLFATLLILPVLASLVSMYTKASNVLFLPTGVAFNVLFHLCIYSQMAQCITRFNRSMKKTGDGLREPF